MQTLTKRLAALESQTPQDTIILVTWLRTGELTRATSGGESWSRSESDTCEQAFIDRVVSEVSSLGGSPRLIFAQ